jgi:hypothetical protein
MPDCPASDQSGTGMKKLTMPGIVRYIVKQYKDIMVCYITAHYSHNQQASTGSVTKFIISKFIITKFIRNRVYT